MESYIPLNQRILYIPEFSLARTFKNRYLLLQTGSQFTNSPPRFGLGLKLPNDKTDVIYYGYGPYESYSDKHRASWVDRFDTTVDDMFED